MRKNDFRERTSSTNNRSLLNRYMSSSIFKPYGKNDKEKLRISQTVQINNTRKSDGFAGSSNAKNDFRERSNNTTSRNLLNRYMSSTIFKPYNKSDNIKARTLRKSVSMSFEESISNCPTNLSTKKVSGKSIVTNARTIRNY